MKNNGGLRIGLYLLIALLGIGCVQTKPVPSYARPGDTIVLGLGGIHRNANSNQNIVPGDLTIVLTDDADENFTLSVVNVFKVFPGYASRLNVASLEGVVAGGLNLQAFDGGWFAIVRLTEGGNPIDAVEGPATISITSSKLVNTNLSAGLVGEGDLTDIPIEILAGDSAVDPDYEQQFAAYAMSGNLVSVAPQDLGSIDSVGGANLVVNYSGAQPPLELLVVPSGHNPYVQLSYKVLDNGDGSGSIRATVINPSGFTTAALQTPRQALLADLQLLFVPINNATTTIAYAVDTAESYYFDLDGDTIQALDPELLLMSEL
tara:strand:+ start:227 stop:1183 length:957 start_codon:yes stop_codon:yes gene_type:complete